MMIKPRKRNDVKEVLFYNGYWIIDYGNGYYSAGKNIGYSPKESMLKRIDGLHNAEQIEIDIQTLKEKKEKTQQTLYTYENEINKKMELLQKIKVEKTL